MLNRITRFKKNLANPEQNRRNIFKFDVLHLQSDRSPPTHFFFILGALMTSIPSSVKADVMESVSIPAGTMCLFGMLPRVIICYMILGKEYHRGAKRSKSVSN